MKSDKINIFYTDDDPDDVDFFKDAIDAAGSEVNLVARFDGDDLLHLLDNPPPYPSMIFLDWNMPGKDGAYLLKEIMANQRTREIPVIILSTSDLLENVQRARKLGAKMYITKPNSFRELVDMIKHCLTIDWNTFNPDQQRFLYN